MKTIELTCSDDQALYVVAGNIEDYDSVSMILAARSVEEAAQAFKVALRASNEDENDSVYVDFIQPVSPNIVMNADDVIRNRIKADFPANDNSSALRMD